MAFPNVAARLLAVRTIASVRHRCDVDAAARSHSEAASSRSVAYHRKNYRYLPSSRRRMIITLLAQSHGGAVRTFAACAYCAAVCRTRLCRMRNIYCSHSGRMIWRSIIRLLRGHTRLADYRRSVPADWNYGVLFFSTENPAVPHRGLALVSRNTGSGYRVRSGWRANHGGPLLLYSVDRFVHCTRVRISGHRQELACCAIAQHRNSWRGSPDPCHSHERADSALA